MDYFIFDKKKYPFVKIVYIKVFIAYIKKIYKYINYKKLSESIKEKGLKLPVNKDIILTNTPPPGRNKIFTYYERKRKLIGRSYPRKILEPIYFKIIKLIDLFIRF